MEIKREHILILEIAGLADVGLCRRKAVGLSKQIGFDDVRSGEIAILVSELITNVLKHGGGSGRIMVCQLADGDNRKAIEVWCCDNGEGIQDFDTMVGDGVSNKNSLGIGLGTIRRFSDLMEVNPGLLPVMNGITIAGLEQFSHRVRIVKWVPENKWIGTNRNLLTGAVSRSKPGEVLSGDSFLINHLSPFRTIVAIIDGLGHGRDAHLAANLAKEQIMQRPELPVDTLLTYVHQAIRGTRGAVLGLLHIDTEKHKLYFTGIGNIEGFLITSTGKKNLLSFGGIVGHNIRTPRVFEFVFEPGDTACVYTDGVNSRWRIDEINWNENPQQNAEYLISHFSRPNDDATILIIRHVT